MRADGLVALALALAAPAAAQDLGTAVTFGSDPGVRLAADARGALDDGQLSDPIPGEWDSVLVQGVLPDPAVRLLAARESPAPLWKAFHVRRRPDGRFWGRARMPRGRGRLRLRAVNAGAAADHQVSLYGVDVFSEHEGPDAEPSPPPAAPPRGPMDPGVRPPEFHLRQEWLAAPSTAPYTLDPSPWRLTLHHTDGPWPTTLAESLAEARFIQDFHQRGRGWNDIGYHFLVDPAGRIIEGRPLETLGAHTLANNEGNVGVALLGSYHPPRNDEPSPAQLAAVLSLGRFLVKRFGMRPEFLKGHRDYKETDCPGDRGYPRLEELRRGLEAPESLARAARRAPPAPAALQGAPDWDGQAARKIAARPSATR